MLLYRFRKTDKLLSEQAVGGMQVDQTEEKCIVKFSAGIIELAIWSEGGADDGAPSWRVEV